MPHPSLPAKVGGSSSFFRASSQFAFSLLVSLAAGPAAIAQPAPTALKPDWSHTAAADIEWSAPVGDASAPGLLVCSKTAQIDWIDLRTGRSLVHAAIPVQPGTRFAGSTAGAAYAWGPTTIYAILARPRAEDEPESPGLLWQVSVASTAETAGDPEFLTRVVAARATSAGVLIVRTDGRVAELDRGDGGFRWQHELPRVTDPRLHLCDSRAALRWTSAGVLHAAFFDLRAQTPQPRTIIVEDRAPIWSALVPEGLLAVWPDRLRLITPDGVRSTLALAGEIVPTAATLATYAQPGPSSQRSAAPVRLLAEDREGNLCAIDTVTGEREPWSPSHAARARPQQPRDAALWLSDGVAIRTSADGAGDVNRECAEFFDSATRAAVARLEGRSILGAATRDGFAYGLFSDRSPGDEPRPIRLLRQTMIGRPRPRPDEVVEFGPRTYLLGDGQRVLDVFWLDGKLVVVEDKRIRAYTLP